jgi:hypothetical protein
VEQAGTMGKRRAVRGNDRPTLDPIFDSVPKARLEMRDSDRSCLVCISLGFLPRDRERNKSALSQ